MIYRVLAVVGFAAVLAFAQSTAPASVDVSEEPKHHLAFENEYVRAFEVEVPVGTETLVHRHTKPYMYVSIGDADVRNDVVGKDPVTIHPKDGEVKFVNGGFAHKAVNVGNTDFRNVTVELLKPAEIPSHALDERQFSRCTGETCDTHFCFPGGCATTIGGIRAGGSSFREGEHNVLIIALTDIIVTHSGMASKRTEIKAGHVMWLPDTKGEWVYWHPSKNAHLASSFFTYLELSN